MTVEFQKPTNKETRRSIKKEAEREAATKRPQHSREASVLALQRTAGNRVVTRLVRDGALADAEGHSTQALQRSPLAAPGPAHVVQHDLQPGSRILRSPEKELISKHTSGLGNIREDQLAAELLQQAQQRKYAFIQSVFNELGSTDRDDVALEMTNAAPDTVLDRIAGVEEGRRLLDRMFDELTSGSVAQDETLAADRIMKAKSHLIDPEKFVPENLQGAKIFPFRLPGLTVFSDAPITAERRPKGVIWVNQPTRVLGTEEFREETRTLPTKVFTAGVELPESEIVGVRMYDLGGNVVYRPALFLVQLANETTTTTLSKIAEAAGLALSLGPSALAGLGVRAGIAARVLMWADRAALVIGTAATVIQEHRGWIIRRLGEPGKQFLHYVDIVNSAVALYGFARVAISVGQLINGLRTAKWNWQAAARSAESELSAEERQVVKQIDDQTEEVLQSAEQIRSANEAKAGQQPTAGQVPEGAPVESGPLAGIGDDEIDAAVDAATRPAVRGGKKPTIGNKRVPTERHPQLDMGDIPKLPGESTKDALTRVKTVIGRRISDMPPSIRDAWERARAHVLIGKTLSPSNYKKLYKAAQQRFWLEVRKDAKAGGDAQELFQDAGFAFGKRKTNAPTLAGLKSDIPVEEIRISLDHIKEKAQPGNWKYALDADNLELTFHSPNSYRETVQMRHPELRP